MKGEEEERSEGRRDEGKQRGLKAGKEEREE